jgi:urease accessory protein
MINRATSFGSGLAGLITAGVLLAPEASAHTGVHASGAWLEGATHPFTGIDHLVAMVLIGLIAARYTRNAWVIPGAFVSMAIIGGLAGLAQPQAIVETGVQISIFVLLAWLVAGSRAPLAAGVAVAAMAGGLHGWAHGGEQTLNPDNLWFLAGMAIATSALHASGFLLGNTLNALSESWRRGGWAIVGGLLAVASTAAVVG